MTPRVIVLTVPMPRNISNGPFSNRFAVNAAKKRYWEHLDLLAAVGPKGQIPPPPPEPFERAKISSVMYLGAAMDEDNAMRRHKWVADWLRRRGYIRDDRPRNLKWTGFPAQIVKRADRYRIVLTIEEVPPDQPALACVRESEL